MENQHLSLLDRVYTVLRKKERGRDGMDYFR